MTTNDQTYSSRKTAVAGAKRALTKLGVISPMSDVHFVIETTEFDKDGNRGFYWTRMDPRTGLPWGQAEVATALEQEVAKGHLVYNEEGRKRLQDAAKTAIQNVKDTPVSVASPSQRWRKPKEVAPAKKAYRPRPGSLQEQIYQLLIEPEGATPERICAGAIQAGASAKSWQAHLAWNEIKYLLVTVRGYGLKFDGTNLFLLLPKVEHDAKGS